MGCVMLFILSSRLLLYSTGSGVNRVPVVLSGFSVRLLFCPGDMIFFREAYITLAGRFSPLPGPSVKQNLLSGSSFTGVSNHAYSVHFSVLGLPNISIFREK